MARTDSDDDAKGEPQEAAVNEESPDAMASEDEDGYRRTRRQQLRGDDKPAKEEPEKKPLPASGYDSFMEEHWESWLKPVLGLVLLAAGYMGYKWEVLPEYTAGLLLSGGLVAMTVYGTAEPAYNLIRQPRFRMLFFGLCLVWGFAAGFPTVRKAYPRQVLGEATLSDDKKSETVKMKGPYAGPYDVTISGKLESPARRRPPPATS